MNQGNETANDDVVWEEVPPPASRQKKVRTYLVGVLCLAVLWAAIFAASPLILRLASRLTIASGSMEPTLSEGRFVSYDRLYYHTGKHPARGDIVAFKVTPRDRIYAKRIIGLPGDTLQVKKGRLYINGNIVERSLQGVEHTIADDGTNGNYSKYTETLPEGVSYDIYEISDDGPLDNTPQYSLTAGEYFMLGDNRDQSLDSRVPFEIGVVPETNIMGRLCETLSGKWL